MMNDTLSTPEPPTTPHGEQVGQHPLVRLLMDYDNCPDDAVDAAASLIGKLVEVHGAAGDDWELWMNTRSVDWFDEVADLFRPFEANSVYSYGLQT